MEHQERLVLLVLLEAVHLAQPELLVRTVLLIQVVLADQEHQVAVQLAQPERQALMELQDRLIPAEAEQELRDLWERQDQQVLQALQVHTERQVLVGQKLLVVALPDQPVHQVLMAHLALQTPAQWEHQELQALQ